MMDEHKTWQMDGLNATKQVNMHSIWGEFSTIIKILNVKNHKDLTHYYTTCEATFAVDVIRSYAHNYSNAFTSGRKHVCILITSVSV